MNIGDLPDELVSHALSFLSDKELCESKRVSKRFLALSNSVRRVVDLRETRRDVFVRETLVGRTGGITIGLKRFARGAPPNYIPITGFPSRFVSFVMMVGVSDDIYKCDLAYLSRFEVQPLYHRCVKIPGIHSIVGNCKFLKTLIIPRVELPPEAIDAIWTLPRLARLNVSDIKYAPGTRVRFPLSLTDLDASGCKFASHNIGSLVNLKRLNVMDMGLERKEVAAIMALTNLEKLNISWNDSGHPAPDISMLVKLQTLTACMMVTGFGQYYSIPGIASLRHLAVLELENCNLWSNDIKWMASGTNIRDLNLSYNYIDSVGVAHICRASTFLKLDLSYNNVDDEGARTITLQSRLEYLDLQHNYITSAGARDLLDMPLKTLFLARNLISEKEVDEMLEWSNIPALDIGRQRSSA